MIGAMMPKMPMTMVFPVIMLTVKTPLPPSSTIFALRLPNNSSFAHALKIFMLKKQ